MTNNEVNKVIAKYMDKQIELKVVGDNLHLYDRLDACWYLFNDKYTRSLDALVPVWERLKAKCDTEMMYTFNLFDYNGKPWNCSFEQNTNPLTDICIEHESSTAQEAAAHATAKAIIALEEK